jgi:hypothetical protein
VPFLVLLLGGMFALYLGAYGFSALSCARIAGPSCLALAALIALPGITGVAAVVLAFVLYLRPGRHRAVGLIVAGLSIATLAVVFALFAGYPAALAFLLLLYVWPEFLTLIGGLLAFAWSPLRTPVGSPPA